MTDPYVWEFSHVLSYEEHIRASKHHSEKAKFCTKKADKDFHSAAARYHWSCVIDANSAKIKIEEKIGRKISTNFPLI